MRNSYESSIVVASALLFIWQCLSIAMYRSNLCKKGNKLLCKSCRIYFSYTCICTNAWVGSCPYPVSLLFAFHSHHSHCIHVYLVCRNASSAHVRAEFQSDLINSHWTNPQSIITRGTVMTPLYTTSNDVAPVCCSYSAFALCLITKSEWHCDQVLWRITSVKG